MSELKAKALHMGPAQCAVDLGDRIHFVSDIARRLLDLHQYIIS